MAEYILNQVASEVQQAINKALTSVQTVNGVKPDESGNVRIEVGGADWNQNNPKAPDYVKNRPFYEETVETVLFKEHTAIFVADEPYQLPPPVTPIDFNPDNPLFNGTTLRIVWDGVAYDCVTVDGLAGNGKPLGIPNLGNGEPFFFDFETFYVYEGGEHTYSVSIVEETIHKLDAKYLPEYDAVITVNEVDNNRVPTLVSGSNADIIAKLKHGDVPRVLVKHKVISPDGIVHIAVEHPLVHAEFENEQATEGVVLIMSNFSSNLAILPNNEVMFG